jgi:hypothetical protein
MKDRKIFYLNYDLDATTYKYGKVTGMHQGFGGIKTTGSSVTVDAVVPGQGPFAALLVGDYIWFYLSDTNILKRRVATKPSNDQITVDTAVNLGTGIASWYFLPFRIGATDADGGHSVEAYETAFVEVEILTVAAAGGVDLTIEIKGRAPATKWFTLLATKNYAAAPAIDVIEVNKKDATGIPAGGWPNMIGSVRVGVKGNAGFAGTDDISVFLTGNPRW